MAIDLICNTGPILALGKMGILDRLPELELSIVFPKAVAQELDTGVAAGFAIHRPQWIPVLDHSTSPLTAASLDAGEAAVLDLALSLGVKHVCIDEWRGRRAAAALGLQAFGSLGLLGRMVRKGIVKDPQSCVDRALRNGVRYQPELLERFLEALKNEL